MFKYIVTSTVMFFGLLGPAYGHDLYKPNFEELDRDSDGSLTLEEMSAAIDVYFTTHDQNGDGLLSLDEFPSDKNHLRAGLKRVPKVKVTPDPMMQANALLDRMDIDENGGLSFEELNASALKRFDTQDTDGDGELTAEELAANTIARAEKRSAKPKNRLSRAQKVFIKWDANTDGFVAKAEIPREKIRKNIKKIFEDLDVNENALVSLEEFAAITD